MVDSPLEQGLRSSLACLVWDLEQGKGEGPQSLRAHSQCAGRVSGATWLQALSAAVIHQLPR